MKLTKVILVCNDNPLYYQFVNDIYDIWEKRIKIQPHLFIIAKDKTKVNLDFGHRKVQFINPLPNIPTAFQSQVIRLLLPSLYKDDYIIITDIDMIPIKKRFFKKYIKHINDDIFIQFFQNYQMCYNCAKGQVWNDIFQVNSISELKTSITQWYVEFKGAHTTDQRILKKYLDNFKNKKIILTSYLPSRTLIRRLSTYTDPNILFKIKNEELNNYVDLHAHNIFTNDSNILRYKEIIRYLLE